MPNASVTWNKDKLVLNAIYLGIACISLFLIKAVMDDVPIRIWALSF